MNVSTFTRKKRYEYAVGLAVLTFVLLYSRRFPFDVIAIATAVGAALFAVRTRVLRHFAKTPIRQVAYVSLIEPIYNRYTVNVGADEDGNPITERRSEVVG